MCLYRIEKCLAGGDNCCILIRVVTLAKTGGKPGNPGDSMSELTALEQQKETLLAKLQDIEQHCEGVDNEKNARKLRELNAEKSSLLAKRNAIDGELTTLNSSIQEFTGSGKDRILEAIGNQRWFFFENKKKILMDRDTGLLWPDLTFFPFTATCSWCANDSSTGQWLAEHQQWADYDQWQLPTPDELWKLVADKTFYFCRGSNWQILNKYNWLVNYDGQSRKDLDLAGALTGISRNSGYVILCCHNLVPKDYETDVAANSTYYTAKEKQQKTLDIFVNNGLIPLFTDQEVTQLYKRIYVDKPRLLNEMAELDKQIDTIRQAEEANNAHQNKSGIEIAKLLAAYQIPAVDQSLIQYAAAVKSVVDTILSQLDEYEASQAEIISTLTQISLLLAKKYVSSAALTEEENALFQERQETLHHRLSLGLDDVQNQLLSAKSQAAAIEKRIDAINHGDNFIWELGELEEKKHVSFSLLVEDLAHIVQQAQQKVDFFAAHQYFISDIANLWDQWTENYKAFTTSLKDKFVTSCQGGRIREERYTAWFEEWRSKRFFLEKLFLPLVEYSLEGHLLMESNGLTAAEKVLEILEGYKKSLDAFYLEQRKGIYVDFSRQPAGDLMEKLEVETRLSQLAETFQQQLQEIIFAQEKTEERVFLLRWAEPVMTVSVDEILNFVADHKLDAISNEILTQFAALKHQNLLQFMKDSKAYSDALQKRQREFNDLLFTMGEDVKAAHEHE